MISQTIYILHGRGSNPHMAWIPWLKSQLESQLDPQHYQVKTPLMPSPQFPSSKKWEQKLDEIINSPINPPVNSTINPTLTSEPQNNYVGYSLSCQALLRYLSTCKGNPQHIFLVAPFQTVNYETVYKQTMDQMEKLPFPNIVKKTIANYSLKNSHSWCDQELPWEKLKQFESHLHLFFSTTDYAIKSDQLDLFHSKFPSAHFYIEENAGHFTTADGYKQFPKLCDTILNVINR